MILPRSEYPRWRRYRKRPGYVVDAVDFLSWSIGRDLRQLRRKARLSQAELAARAKMRAATISRLENGHGDPTGKSVRKILRALRADPRA